MSKPAVRAQDLLVGYGGAPVCAPVTFTLSPGKAVALVGANGSGKSTVLRAVIGLLEPSGGKLAVFGEEVDEREIAFRTQVASVLDDDAYFPALTVYEHLYLTARGHGVVGADGVVTGLLEEFGLTEHSRSLPVALSSGQRRRLLLAAGFVRPRSLLVLDEPEQRLDRAMRDRLAERLVAEKRAGGAVLLATHDPDLVLAVADRAVHVADDVTRVLAPAEAATLISKENP
ncbi:ABC transporter ATP-binding protein [Cellulomonas rhizosphaerae]|uniref:ABC transporter ATP-binding protein n=1 Tax=Cellulomonas rhizosphaerae TaxID=2293719 RepID=A0A413RP83_9CELL|nr:ABC transporter ATP-binding protein [Cellulomonas rhizosphaerae]RHA43777.1 ABC transporter ATP-binding protein [Cellulomonas rhizosphaerae]